MFFAVKLKWMLGFFIVVCTLGLFLSLGAINVFKEDELQGIDLPILMYHHILKEEKMHGAYVISPEEFEADLKYLKEKGYNTVLISDLINYTKNLAELPENPVMLTFDDGYLSTLKYAGPLLEKYNMRAVVSVVGSITKLYDTTPDRNISYAHLNFRDLKEMEESKVFEIQNHSYDMHKNAQGKRHGSKKLYGESEKEYIEKLKKDLGECQNLLLENAGIMPTCYTYPFGMISKESIEPVKEMGFLASLSCYEGENVITKNPDSLYLLKRYNRAHKRSAEKILE